MSIAYVVIDRATGDDAQLSYPHCPMALTPEGKVVWWNESGGWEEDEDQSRYEVRMTTNPA